MKAKPPLVHMNGTSKQQLIDVRERAWYALSDAFAALREIAPNGRDYYPYGPDELGKAIDANMDRMRLVQSVIDELAEEMVAISDQ